MKRRKADEAHRHPPVPCSACGKSLDAATVIGSGIHSIPTMGDVSICLYCGHIAIFKDNNTLREMTLVETLRVLEHPLVTRAQRVRSAFMSGAAMMRKPKHDQTR